MFYSPTAFGKIKLLVSNSFYDKEFDSSSMSSYEEIYDINYENFKWYTYAAQ